MLGVEPRAWYKLSTCLAKYVSVLLLTGSWLGREGHAQVWTVLAGLPMEETMCHLEKVPQLAMIFHKHGPEVFTTVSTLTSERTGQKLLPSAIFTSHS